MPMPSDGGSRAMAAPVSRGSASPCRALPRTAFRSSWLRIFAVCGESSRGPWIAPFWGSPGIARQLKCFARGSFILKNSNADAAKPTRRTRFDAGCLGCRGQGSRIPIPKPALPFCAVLKAGDRRIEAGRYSIEAFPAKSACVAYPVSYAGRKARITAGIH